MAPAAHPRGIIGSVGRVRERANLVIERELAARGIEGIAPAHGAVLAFLFRQTEPVPIKDIVAAAGRTKSTVTGMLKNLERNGVIRRLPDESDSRVTLIELTGRGRALEADFKAISQRLLEAVYGAMPQRDRETLVRLLAQIEENLIAQDLSTAPRKFGNS